MLIGASAQEKVILEKVSIEIGLECEKLSPTSSPCESV